MLETRRKRATFNTNMITIALKLQSGKKGFFLSLPGIAKRKNAKANHHVDKILSCYFAR